MNKKIIIVIVIIIIAVYFAKYIPSNEHMTGTGGYSDGDIIRNSTTGELAIIVNGKRNQIDYGMYQQMIEKGGQLYYQAIPNTMFNTIPRI